MEQAPKQPPEYPRPYGVAAMTLEQVSTLNSQLAARWEVAAGWKPAPEGEPALPFDQADQDKEALHYEVRQFIRDDPPRATELMQQLAHSESAYDRRLAARNTDELCVANVEVGADLWIELLLDREVGEAAFFAMDRGLSERRYSHGDYAWTIVRLGETLEYWYGKAEALQRDRDRGRP